VIAPLLAGLLLSAAGSARAQGRAVELDARLAPPSAPAPLSAAPAMVPSLLAAPALAAPLAAPAAFAAPVAAPAALPAAAVTAARPAAALAAAPPAAKPGAAAPVDDKSMPESLRGVARLLDEAGPGGTRSLSDDQLVALTQRLAGEGGSAAFAADYLGRGRALDFGAPQAFRYQAALKAFKSGHADGPEAVKTLLDSARELAGSAGIEVEPVIRPSPSGEAHAGLRVLPRRDGSLLNRLAFNLDRRYQASLEYVPERLIGAVAAYNSHAKVMFLPDFGRRDAFEAILHESAHAQFTERLARGALSPFHGQLVAYDGRAIAPGASSYVTHMSLEEIATHGKEVKHQLAAARGAGDASLEALLPTLTFLYQYADVLRSARLNLAIARSYVKNGTAQVRLAENEPEPFPGGRWYRVNLPYGRFYFPVREEPPVKQGLLRRVFGSAPETAAEKALRRRADALLTATAEIDASLVKLEAGIKADAPDLKALNAEADLIVVSLRRAESSFAAPDAR